MNLENALELKSELIRENYKQVREDAGLRVNGLSVDLILQRRLGVGLSRQAENDYHLEIRIMQRRGGAAQSAQQVKDKAEKEVHIGVIQQLRIPSLSELISGVQQHPGLPGYCCEKRPLHLGLSLSHVDGGVGTLGGFVEKNGRNAILSNCHVLALSGNAALSSPIFSPGGQDVVGPFTPRHKVGILEEFTIFSNRGANYLDAAYASLLDGIMPDPNGNAVPDDVHLPPDAPPPGTKISEPPLPLPGISWEDIDSYPHVRPNQVVAKIGRTTGYRLGCVTAISLDDIIIPVPPHGERRFDDLIEVSWISKEDPFARPGDSGSLVFSVDKDPSAAANVYHLQGVGIHFAGGVIERDGKEIGVSYACSLVRTLVCLGLIWL
jgi:hypothetical protein